MENALLLIAEDDLEIAEILRAYLEREGFRVVCAENGEAALKARRRSRATTD